MADNKYKLQFTLSNGETINAGEIVAPQGPKGDKGDSADIPYSSSTPFMDGEGSVGSANTVARGDHRHPSDTSRQEKLVSGTNIKTINGQSVLGSGDIPISGGGSEYANTSEIVSISLTASDDITSLANKILANKTKVSKISAYDSNVVRILGSNPYPDYQASYISLYFTVLAYDRTILVTCVPSNVDGPSLSAKTTYINNLYAPDGNYYWYACSWDNIDAAYPVGAIYINAEGVPGSYDPAAFFGGTWEQINDVFLLAAGNTYPPGSTGGEATHTLTIDEMPTHSHNYLGTVAAQPGGSTYAETVGYGGSRTGGTSMTPVYAGGDSAHNNMPPYLTVYMWKRIA